MNIEEALKTQNEIEARWRLLLGFHAEDYLFLGWGMRDDIIVIWARHNWSLEHNRVLMHRRFFDCVIKEGEESPLIKEYNKWFKEWKSEGKGGQKHVIETALNTNLWDKYVKIKQDNYVVS